MRKYYLVFDSETTINGTIYEAAFILGYYNKAYNFIQVKNLNVILKEQLNDELFHNKDNLTFFGYKNLQKRHEFYSTAIENGTIQVKSVAGVQSWLDKCYRVYSPVLLSYNIAFDIGAAVRSGLDVSRFESRCIWAASTVFFKRSGYIKYCIKNRLFSPKAVMRTSCEALLPYLGWNEQHTHKAIDDVIDEAFIYGQVLRQRKAINVSAYNWRLYCLPVVIERGLNIAL